MKRMDIFYLFCGIGLLFLLCYIAFFSPILFSDRLLAPGDGFVQSVPAYYSSRVLWSTLLFGGFPFAADPQAMAWYPPALFCRLLPNSWNMFVLLAYILASSFSFGLVWGYTKNSFASLISGLVFGMSGFLMAHLGHTNMIHAAVWIPAVLLGIEKQRLRFSYGWYLVACGSVAMCALAGHPQILIYALGLAGIYVLVRGWNAQVGKLKFFFGGLSALILGTALSAVQLLPAAELSRYSLRAQMGFDIFNHYALKPWQWAMLLFPYLFGGISDSFYGKPYFGPFNLTELTGYIGILPLMLAVISLGLRPKNYPILLWGGVAFISLLLVAGNATPLVYVMYHLPAFNRFQAPARHFLEFSLAFSILAGLGISILQQEQGLVRLKWTKRGVTIVVGLILLTYGLMVLFRGYLRNMAYHQAGILHLSILPWQNKAIYIPLFVATLSSISLLLWCRKPNGWRNVLLGACLFLDLGSFGWFYEWKYYAPPKVLLNSNDFIEKQKQLLAASHQRLMSVKGALAPWESIPPNLSSLWGIPNLSGYNPLILLRVSNLLGMNPIGDLSGIEWSKEKDYSLDIMSARYILLPKAEVAKLADSPRWLHIEDLVETSVFENLRARPRAWLVSRVETLPPDKILMAIQTSQLPNGDSFDPSSMALVEEPLSFQVDQSDSQASVRVIEEQNKEIEVASHSSSPSFLVLSDVNYPGWRATIDGQPGRIYQTDYVLRGVKVQPGNHRIHFEFHPNSFYLGAGCSASTILILLVYGVFLFVRRQNRVQERS